MERKTAISIKDLSYGYRGNWSLTRKNSLHPFSLDVHEGESFGFLGHNGAGKTTTIKCILNLIRPTAGSISLFGTSSIIPESRRKVGYIPEQPYFYDHITVKELLSFYGTLSGLRGKACAVRVEEELERLSLTHKMHVQLRTLSKGLMQRVALAQALLARPKLLILDEPFSGLDPVGRKKFREIFSSLRSEGTTLFISSHILSDVEALCDRVSILVNGSLKGVFAIKEVLERKNSSLEDLFMQITTEGVDE